LRVLLDEIVHRGVKRLLPGHEVVTVQECGWSSITNGELLRCASADFDVFVTADLNIPDQQNLERFDVGVVVLVVGSDRIQTYEAVADRLQEAVGSATKGSALVVTA
jgi:hypothetical protein